MRVMAWRASVVRAPAPQPTLESGRGSSLATGHHWPLCLEARCSVRWRGEHLELFDRARGTVRKDREGTRRRRSYCYC